LRDIAFVLNARNVVVGGDHRQFHGPFSGPSPLAGGSEGKKRGNSRHVTDDGGRGQEHSAGEEKGKKTEENEKMVGQKDKGQGVISDSHSA
jgi:hypothetical protein